MLLVTALSILIHIVVVARAVTFFRQRHPCRESDKSTVAVLGGLSGLFILAQILVWGDSPWRLINGSVGMSLLMAFNFANAFFYLATIESLTDRKACHPSSLN